ncbi:LLM class flavin-dependent oxidoreductase [Paenibacillus amylolyticus]|uniref:LLM class flavin-dependent oxidoreductase n=2 Tax=Paenibacillus amylolyticus TaxID=1451 RepID=A0A5M9WTX3_PAEAM|nr:LLM class flavin-dependent oxidoreductase [Paenibacillus amylolyticus]
MEVLFVIDATNGFTTNESMDEANNPFIQFELPGDLSRSLLSMGGSSDYALYVLLTSGVWYLMELYTNQNRVVVGMPAVDEDESPEFLSPLMFLEVQTTDLHSYKEFLFYLKGALSEALKNRNVPAHHLYDRLALETSPDGKLLLQTIVSLDTLHHKNMEIRKSVESDIWFHFEKREECISVRIDYTVAYQANQVERIHHHLIHFFRTVTANPDVLLDEITVLTENEIQMLKTINDTRIVYDSDQTIHGSIEAQAADHPDRVALCYKGKEMRFEELNRRANQLARFLSEVHHVQPNDRVALMMDRSLEMVIVILAILKSGAAYLPIDPTMPPERVRSVLEDSESKLILTQSQYAFIAGDASIVLIANNEQERINQQPSHNLPSIAVAEDLAYIIYTSGSTGKPKGVMVEHRNVINFFAAMDEQLKPDANDAMLALTTVSFDISVLELLWTLSRGVQVTIHPNDGTQWEDFDAYLQPSRVASMEFSLFFFSSYDHAQETDKYRLLLETATYADQHGFRGVWTPERHFHEFGGLYPNPSVVSAALAMVTNRLKIRSGSVVSPLHDTIRIAEEWAVVDNLSKGRVELSFASGWHADDFVFSPDKYQGRKEEMVRQIEQVRSLWRGESVTRQNGFDKSIEVKTYPRPIQKELPIWITTGGNRDSFIEAGKMGANVLTHLLGQDLDQLKDNISLYRRALKENGFEPHSGKVALMLHTFIGEDMESVKEIVRKPFIDYLRSSLSLIKNLAEDFAIDPAALEDPEVIEKVLEMAFEKYWDTAALLGTSDSCSELIEQLSVLGVDEAACLIDFGVEKQAVMDSLHRLAALKERFRPDNEQLQKEAASRKITMLQCTPSRLGMLLTDERSQAFLGSLKKIIIGGEALPTQLAESLRKRTSGEIYNMYGPTETTVWSTCYRLMNIEGTIPIGRPIGNTQVYVLDKRRRMTPIGGYGELYIGGDGVTRGYWARESLTAERYVQDPFSDKPNARLYRTGDIGKFRDDGTIEFLGREDHQVKIRGHRIELDEIEYWIREYEPIRDCVVSARKDDGEETYLCAYVVSNKQLSTSELRGYLLQQIPNYMVPARFVVLDQLPLTFNGKIDRNSLPDPSSLASVREGDDMPSSETERELQHIWAQVLRVDANAVGMYDNFFDLGGNSILLIQLNSQINKRFPDTVSMTTQFSLPNIKALAGYIDKKGKAAIARVAFPDSYFESSGEETSLYKKYQYRLEGEALTALLDKSVYHHTSIETIVLAVYIYLLSELSDSSMAEVEYISEAEHCRLKVDVSQIEDLPALFAAVERSERVKREWNQHSLLEAVSGENGNSNSVIILFGEFPEQGIVEASIGANLIRLQAEENEQGIELSLVACGHLLNKEACKGLFNRIIRSLLGFASRRQES